MCPNPLRTVGQQLDDASLLSQGGENQTWDATIVLLKATEFYNCCIPESYRVLILKLLKATEYYNCCIPESYRVLKLLHCCILLLLVCIPAAFPADSWDATIVLLKAT
eukprot:514708-Rhodomonas_salina.1